MTKRLCSECVNAFLQDTGYSNYTVEGTNLTCMMNLNPNGTFDRFYGNCTEDEYAKNCSEYQKGEPFHADVDGEDTPNEEQKMRMFMLGFEP